MPIIQKTCVVRNLQNVTAPPRPSWIMPGSIMSPNRETGVRYVLPPLLGVYDRYAIRIGYAYLSRENTRTVAGWIDEKQNDPMYHCGRMAPSTIPTDPTVQTSDLGNDPVASATYGIRNLQQILTQLPEWNKKRLTDNPFEEMPATYTDLQQAYFDHLERVIPFIGFSDEVSGKAVEFLWKELLGGYNFLRTDAVCKYAGNPTEAIIKAQKTIIEKMFGRIIAERISSNETPAGFTYAHYLEVSANLSFYRTRHRTYSHDICRKAISRPCNHC